MLGKMQAPVRNQLREITESIIFYFFPCWNKTNNLETVLLFLHQGFFAQALAAFPCPCDPLRSPLRQSFLTAYQSAIGVLSATQKQFAHQPAVCLVCGAFGHSRSWLQFLGYCHGLIVF